MNAPDILESIGTAFLIPGVWTQEEFARNASGHVVNTGSSDACKFCSLGALMQFDSYESNLAYQALCYKVGTYASNWNDAKGQTAENVAATMFELAAELRAKQ